MATAQTAYGLDGVVVADTVLSEVDGEKGRLVLRGHDVEGLAGRVRFEDVLALLWDGALPTAAEREALRARLGRARVRAFARVEELRGVLAAVDGMDALRGAVAALPSGETDRADLVAALAVFAAAWARLRAGEAPVAPDEGAWHAQDYLRMATGRVPDAARAGALEAYLVTVTEHGMNASTFTARVVASTASDDVSAITAAICALKGPLHGGAPGPVLDMLDAVGAPERAAEWLEGELRAKRRIMGMGHRIYRVRDPRAAVLERAIEALERGGVRTERLALARAVERAAEGALRARYPDRPMHANVEFYTALVLDAVGLPREAFSPTFAVGRVVGWTAHTAEQRTTSRIIRPASRYVGPAAA